MAPIAEDIINVSDSEAKTSSSTWTDANACTALCMLILDDRRYPAVFEDEQPCRYRRRALPPALYAENVAPFLRFDAPQPNMLYAFGGRNQRKGPLNTVEMFDSWHGRWVPCPPMPTRRAGSAAALLPDGRFIVVGGYNEKGIAEGLLSCCDIYDPRVSSWAEEGSAQPLSRARWGHGCAPLRGKVYVVGGCSLQPDAQPREASMETLKCCEVYDPPNNRWSPCAPLQIARSGSRVVALDDRYLAAIGGCDDVFGRAETQPTVEIFDVIVGCWSLLEGQLLHPRTTAAAAAIDGRRLLVVGGAPSLSSAEVYRVQLPREGSTRPNSDEEPVQSSESVTDMPDGRMGCQAALINLPAPGANYPMSVRKSVVVVGGERCDEGGGDWPRVRQFSNVPVFDVETGEWRSDSPVPAMAAHRTAVALCVGMGRLFSLH